LILILGIIAGVSIFLKVAPGYPRLVGVIIIFVYGFIFFVFFVLVKIIKFLLKLTDEIKR
ncbi:MAG: hypothetical protein NC909_01575, partial [Candidatus Omnitrophica bacterium]|nr:hypothetical protein [Candidatus Omnitrophota bacterium]